MQNKTQNTHNTYTADSKTIPLLPQLETLGWSPFFAEQYDPSAAGRPARVIGANRLGFSVNFGDETGHAFPAGRFYKGGEEYPVVGDWVLVKDELITWIFARKNFLSRKAAGRRSGRESEGGEEQGMAANLDFVFIVCGLDRDYNPARIERYLMLAYGCGIEPVILLTKADLQENPAQFVSEIEAGAPGVLVTALSPHDSEAVAQVAALLKPGVTAALVGSSGAGKSTLVNRLAGEEIQETAAVGARGGKGRHTTTSRELIVLPGGGLVIDNPGIREIGLTGQDVGSDTLFPDIDALAEQCRFSDCTHTCEPGCRVLEAVRSGELSARRLNSYSKLNSELAYSRERQSKSASRVEKERRQHISRMVKEIKRGR